MSGNSVVVLSPDKHMCVDTDSNGLLGNTQSKRHALLWPPHEFQIASRKSDFMRLLGTRMQYMK